MSTIFDFTNDGLDVVPTANFDAATMIDVDSDLSSVTNVWSTLTPGLTSRKRFSSANVGNDIYIFGGTNFTIEFNELWKYNTLNDSWSQLTSGATARYSSSLMSVGTDLYVFGGVKYGGGVVDYNDIWKYDTLNDSWIQVVTSGTPPAPRQSLGYESIGTNLYIFGGWDSGLRFNDIFKFDTLTNTWTTLTPFIHIEIYHSMTHVGNKLYFLNAWGSVSTNDFWEYDIVTNTWTQLSSGPSNSIHYQITAIGTDVFIFVGTVSWKYDTLTDTWLQLPTLPISINQWDETSSSTAIYNNAYIFSDTGSNISVNKYNLINETDMLNNKFVLRNN